MADRFFRFKATTGYCGADDERYVRFPEEVTEEELQEYADDFAHDNAATFEYLVFGWDADPVEEGEMTQEEYDQQIEDYYADCCCEYVEVSKEEFEENEGVDA